MARQPLEVGKQVWLEDRGSFIRTPNDERKIYEYQIVEANRSSAYAVDSKRLAQYKQDPKRHSYMKRRIDQRTHVVIEDGFGSHYVLWLSPAAFEKNVAYAKETKEVRQQSHAIIDKLPLSELKKFIDQYN